MTSRSIAREDAVGSLDHVGIFTVVIHGGDDPLVPVYAGKATARLAPKSSLLVLPGMGDDIPRTLWTS